MRNPIPVHTLTAGLVMGMLVSQADAVCIDPEPRKCRPDGTFRILQINDMQDAHGGRGNRHRGLAGSRERAGRRRFRSTGDQAAGGWQHASGRRDGELKRRPLTSASTGRETLIG
jgi:hypothetical protein